MKGFPLTERKLYIAHTVDNNLDSVHSSTFWYIKINFVSQGMSSV